jgi:glycosyltransferase involved in cell wall biosynthesis
MRVLFDHPIFSYQTFGGASRYFAELMAAFARSGDVDFDLGVAESPNEYLKRMPYFRGTSVARPAVAGFVRTYLRNELATRAASLRRHDLIHTTFYDPVALVGRRGAALAVTLHDMIPELFPSLFPARGLYGRAITRRWIQGKRRLCERADLVLAVSEHTKRDAVRLYGLDPDKIVVVHHGVSLAADYDVPPVAYLPARYLLFVGTRQTYKNFDGFIAGAAPALHRDPALAIVCVGGGELDRTELSLLERHGLVGRAVQHRLSDGELAAAYAHARAFVFPSRYEGFGMPILEAFACGCPAIVADASCFPEIAGDAALRFDPDTPDALSQSLDRVLADAAVRDALIARGKARAKAFTWDAAATATAAAYRSVVHA